MRTRLPDSAPAGDVSVLPPAPEATVGVPLLRPRLPGADRLLPYLRRIDANRVYSNHGPLVVEFEERLEGLITPDGGAVVSASSGTAAIIGAILATAGRATAERPLALVPAFTFVATAVAAEACGYRIALADIDAEDWMLHAEAAADHPLLSEVGVVVPVSTFGRPAPQAPWCAFQGRTGIPVVIDGAASFDRLIGEPERYVGDIPVAFSFHATKAFGTGEGGCVATADEALAGSIIRALNFGFRGERDSRSASINGKLSEYHAAVGLAELDGWPAKQAAFQAVIEGYRRHLGELGLMHCFVGAPDISLGYALFVCDHRWEALRVRDALAGQGIETRAWYGRGLRHQSHFASASVADGLPVTDEVAPRVLGLPMAPDLTDGQISVVASALARALSSGR
jgi:dTDP-4-amino-4,6-dideoxygalactose transaminase